LNPDGGGGVSNAHPPSPLVGGARQAEGWGW